MCARLVWKRWVGSQDLCCWRLRNLDFGMGGLARVGVVEWVLILGVRDLTAGVDIALEDSATGCREGFSAVVGWRAETVTFSLSLAAFLCAPRARRRFTLSTLNRICRVGFLVFEVTVGVRSPTIYQPHLSLAHALSPPSTHTHRKNHARTSFPALRLNRLGTLFTL